MTPITLSLAGSDPSGGAGIQADIKTICATGSFAASVITALTAQNTQGVQGIYEIDPAFIEDQLRAVLEDLSVCSIKIGMLSNEKIIASIVGILTLYPSIPIILDPVMIAKSGHALLNPAAVLALKNQLCPLATLITPNLPEAERLLEQAISSQKEMSLAAITLGKLLNTHILIKGGHAGFLNTPDDVFYSKKDDTCTWLTGEYIHTKNTHGTGCTLSSAIASYLAQGCHLPDAISQAKHYVTQCLKKQREFSRWKRHWPFKSLLQKGLRIASQYATHIEYLFSYSKLNHMKKMNVARKPLT